MTNTEQLYDWLKTKAWPLWLRYGVDWQKGAFYESLSLEGYQSTAYFRRLRVVARQIYVFSQAHQHGIARAGEAVEVGLSYLKNYALQSDGGYAWRFSVDGDVLDNRRDLYDHAFVLLALSAAARVVPSDELRAQALGLVQFIVSHMRHPSGGYVEQIPAVLPRRQNPHMHLIEAFLAAFEQFKEPVFLTCADELIQFFTGSIFQKQSSTVPEYFDDSMRVNQENGLHVWEPGHHCEWIWLLDWYERLKGTKNLDSLRASLWQSVSSFGFEQAQKNLINEVWSNGIPKDQGQRLWPQTERLKAEKIMQGSAEVSAKALHGFLRADGLWQERFYAAPDFANKDAPASSLYHLTCGILFAANGGRPL